MGVNIKEVISINKKQYQRWKSFSIQMAKTMYEKCTPQRQAKILNNVEDFFYWRKFQNDYRQYTDWDGNGDEYSISSVVDDFFEDHRHWNPRTETEHDYFYRQVTCCIRAGFDLAVKQSGGVVGFTCGQVRKMWKGAVPFWVKKEFDNFDSIPDGDPVWL